MNDIVSKKWMDYVVNCFLLEQNGLFLINVLFCFLILKI